MKKSILFALLVAAALVTGCGSEGAATPTEVPPTSTVEPTPTSLPMPTATPTPTATSTPEPSLALRVDEFECQRFFPGVPNPDGPNEWLNVSGAVTNTGSRALSLPPNDPQFQVRVLNADGALIVTLLPEFAGGSLESGQSSNFSVPSVHDEHPAAESCELVLNAGLADPDIEITGMSNVEVTILAAP